MLDITRALERAAPFFSFIIGLGISVLLFHRAYGTQRVLAVAVKEIHDKVTKVDGKCYSYRVEDATCENSSSI